jgi:ribosomal protein S18 acetylase RimI-like enzyme
MIQTLNKHVRWRVEKKEILICDCKRLIDLKLPLEYISFMNKLERGVDREKLNEKEKKVFSDFEKMKLLSNLEIRQITPKEFDYAMDIFDEELGKDRGIKREFLHKKFKEIPKFFIGIFLGDRLIGAICGFPREDYLPISKIAIISRFQNRNFGRKLVERFEEIARKQYDKINVGAEDRAIGFYESLPRYKPFLLIQFEKKNYSDENFNKFDIIKKYDFDKNNRAIEVKIKKVDLKYLEKLRKKYPKAWFQYIFTKQLK